MRTSGNPVPGECTETAEEAEHEVRCSSIYMEDVTDIVYEEVKNRE